MVCNITVLTLLQCNDLFMEYHDFCYSLHYKHKLLFMAIA